MTSYVTARDIVIPTGTEVRINRAGMKSKIFCDFASIMIAETNDHTSEWVMPLDEAIELGIVAPVVEQAA